MYQAKSGVKKISLYWWGGGGGRGGPGSPKKSGSKWAETYFGFGIFEIRSLLGAVFTHRPTDRHYSDQISRSTQETERLKSEMKRWRNFFFGSEHVSSQIWCYLKLVRWRVRWRDKKWDEELKKFFWGLNMYQAKSGVIWN